MLFKDKMQIRDAIKEYAMKNINNLVFRKNNKKIMVVKCMEECPFYIRFSMRTTKQVLQLVSFTDQYNCHMTTMNKQAKTD